MIITVRLAVINQKGGVGKSTLSVNLARALTMADYNVLVIDLDAQAQVTKMLQIVPNSNAEKLLFGKDRIDRIIKSHPDMKFDVVYSEFNLHIAQHGVDPRKGKNPLRTRLASIESNYDFIILDCNPYIASATAWAYNYADWLIIPIIPVMVSLENMNNVLEAADLYGRGQDMVLSIIPMMYDKRINEHKDALKALKKHFGELIGPVVGTSADFPAAARHHTSILDYNGRSSGSRDVVKVMRFILDRLEKEGFYGQS